MNSETVADDFVNVARKSEIREGDVISVSVGEDSVALGLAEGSYFAILDQCPHAGAPLSGGYLSGKVLTCPFHAWEFDVKTGTCLHFSAAKVPVYEVKVEGESILVKKMTLPQ